VGSIGFSFAKELTAMAAQFGMRIGKIIKSPMPGLVDFHTKNQ